MSKIVDLDLRNRQPTSYANQFSADLVQDLARYSEGGGLITEKEIRRRYRFDNAVWKSLADNSELLAAISDEQTRRIRSGQAKREIAQKLVVQAPNVLGELLLSKDANPKHRIDAARTLDDFSTDKSAGSAAAGAVFEITINLGPDSITHYRKPIDITAGNIDPNGAAGGNQDSQWELAIAAKNKPKDDDSGQEYF